MDRSKEGKFLRLIHLDLTLLLGLLAISGTGLVVLYRNSIVTVSLLPNAVLIASPRL